ncbi:MAG: sodium:proton antiporter [Clostridia bacterium]|nr:sodium:proton antiporter [Clostridia bacterium]
MTLVQNFPALCILLALVCAVLTSVLKRRSAAALTGLVLMVNLVMNGMALVYTLRTGESYVYRMGHFSAPWGNELRVGVLETGTATVLLLVVLLSYLGAYRRSSRKIEPTKYNLYGVMVDLCVLSLQALIYTNDLFTAYVFIEISTLAASGLIMARQTGRSLVAGVRYMIMNLLGSSLFLLGVVILYAITGHLLMTPIHDAVAELAASGEYRIPLDVTVALISVGLGMKSALYPFEKWVPAAYSNATTTSSALLSSVVSKGYIFLLIKIYVRTIGLPVIESLGITDVMFVFGACGMIMGSVAALRTKTVRMMIAYSSVAQIGYIFLAIGLGTMEGMMVALWHLLAHAATKSMLFVAAAEMDEASGDTHLRKDIRGAFYRSPLAALAFSLGAVNLVGLPLLSVFVTKFMMGQTAVAVGGRHMVVTLVCLAVSTLLNLGYFMSTAMSLFIKGGAPGERRRPEPLVCLGLAGFLVLNLVLSLCAAPIYQTLLSGFAVFG